MMPVSNFPTVLRNHWCTFHFRWKQIDRHTKRASPLTLNFGCVVCNAPMQSINGVGHGAVKVLSINLKDNHPHLSMMRHDHVDPDLGRLINSFQYLPPAPCHKI